MLILHSKRILKTIPIIARVQTVPIRKFGEVFNSTENLYKKKMSNGQGNKNLMVQVVGSGAHGAPASALLRGDQIRVLLNCGEGTQRLINEYKIKWSIDSTHIFITNSSWKNVAGLMGMALSLQKSNKKEMYLHGPELIENVFSATNRFIDIRSVSVKFMNSKTQTKFVDDSYEVYYVPLYPSTVTKLKPNMSDSKLVTSSPATGHVKNSFPNKHDEDSDYDDHLSKPNRHKSKKKKRSHSQVCEMKNQETIHYAMAFIFSIKPTYKLLIDKCVDLNVPIGPMLHKLKNGQDVVLENGNLVKSSDVVAMVSPQSIVVVIECPSENYLESLLQEPAFFKHQSGDSDDIASLVIHFTSSDLVENSKYKDWMNRFPKETKHLFINESNRCLGSVAVHRFQYKLHAVHPEIFPLLPTGDIPVFPRNLERDSESDHHAVVIEENLTQSKVKHIQESSGKVFSQDRICYKCKNDSLIKGETLCEVYLRPKREYDYSRNIVLKPHVYIGEIEAVEGFLENLKQLNSELKFVQSNDRKYPKILFLGTGCSQPSIYRNPSGILVFLDSDNCMLLDCGEGTYNQLVRFFGREKTEKVLKKLNLIFISHLHADHHIGLVKLLKERKLVFDKEAASGSDQFKVKYLPVDLLAPVHLTKWLNFFSNYIEDVSNLYSVIFTNKLCDSEFHQDKLSNILSALNFKEIKTAKMVHCSSSYGVAFTHKDNWKLTYSGDTRPCINLVNIGMNSDILIHEATFDDGLWSLAKSKAHSTTSEAIDIGRQMNAKFILLTHFSQRYSHLPFLDNYVHEGVGVAFDNMMVSYNQLPILPKLLPAMKCLLSKYYDEMVEKRDLLQLKKRAASRSEESSKRVKTSA